MELDLTVPAGRPAAAGDRSRRRWSTGGAGGSRRPSGRSGRAGTRSAPTRPAAPTAAADWSGSCWSAAARAASRWCCTGSASSIRRRRWSTGRGSPTSARWRQPLISRKPWLLVSNSGDGLALRIDQVDPEPARPTPCRAAGRHRAAGRPRPVDRRGGRRAAFRCPRWSAARWPRCAGPAASRPRCSARGGVPLRQIGTPAVLPRVGPTGLRRRPRVRRPAAGRASTARARCGCPGRAPAGIVDRLREQGLQIVRTDTVDGGHRPVRRRGQHGGVPVEPGGRGGRAAARRGVGGAGRRRRPAGPQRRTGPRCGCRACRSAPWSGRWSAAMRWWPPSPPFSVCWRRSPRTGCPATGRSSTTAGNCSPPPGPAGSRSCCWPPVSSW